MFPIDPISEYYSNHITSTYESVDRIVLNAYCKSLVVSGGFRIWWRKYIGNDDTLDNTHLIRFAQRFSRRLRANAKAHNIPVVDCTRGDRKHTLAEQFLPTDPHFKGVFCILVGRAQAKIIDIHRYGKEGIDIRGKKTYVKFYHVHIIDPEWGHIIIRFCPHPPFGAQIILNAHEYVSIQARKKRIGFTKEGNCFTKISNASGLNSVADTMRASGSEGRLVKVCKRWIYSTCLYFALPDRDALSSIHYNFSVCQAEYSHNYLFQRGSTMECIFQSMIDTTRRLIDIKTIKHIFGCRYRHHNQSTKSRRSTFEAVVERPTYDLIIFKIHCGKLTVKVYAKGEHVLRFEAVAHNTEDLRCGKSIEKFGSIIESLKSMVDRFIQVVQCTHTSFINTERLEQWPCPSEIGSTKVGGINVNCARTLAGMKAIMALSIHHKGFTAKQLAEKVRENTKCFQNLYTTRQASYDLKKFRGKNLVRLKEHSRRYEPTIEGLKEIAAYLTLKEKVLTPLLSCAPKIICDKKRIKHNDINVCYQNIQNEMKTIFEIIGIAA